MEDARKQAGSFGLRVGMFAYRYGEAKCENMNKCMLVEEEGLGGEEESLLNT